MNGPRTYVFAPGDSAVFGTGGTLRKYRVAVETGIPVTAEDFARHGRRHAGDPRSWIAGGNLRLQRIGGEAAGTNFTVYLVTPGTARALCLAAGYDIFWRGEPYSSCYTGRVLINLSRYLKGIPDYDAPARGVPRVRDQPRGRARARAWARALPRPRDSRRR